MFRYTLDCISDIQRGDRFLNVHGLRLKIDIRIFA